MKHLFKAILFLVAVFFIFLWLIKTLLHVSKNHSHNSVHKRNH